jgi:glyoxylase-like metal-dependent hydrolase (beta-lactamase superfamily II)
MGIGYEGMDFIYELTPNFYFVQGDGRGLFPYCNGYLLTGEETVLIDTGIGEEKIREIDKKSRIDVVIISHSHPDHIRNWDMLKDRHLLLPRETPDAVHDIELLGQRFAGTVEGGARWVEIFGRGLGILPLREPDGRFGDGDLLEAGGTELEVIHAPGHLDDHYCFLHRKSGTIITTDVDFSSFGPWYSNPESDIELFQAAIKKIMTFPYDRVCSSHKTPMKGRAVKEFEAFLAGFERHKRTVLKLCGSSTTVEEITARSPFFKGQIPDRVIQRTFEGNMIRKILDLLVRDGAVEKSKGRFRKV